MITLIVDSIMRDIGPIFDLIKDIGVVGEQAADSIEE